MHGGVVNENTALLHHFLHMSQAQRVGHVPSNAGQHHLQRVVKPFEHLAQGAVDQTFTKIKHGRDCRLRRPTLIATEPLLATRRPTPICRTISKRKPWPTQARMTTTRHWVGGERPAPRNATPPAVILDLKPTSKFIGR